MAARRHRRKKSKEKFPIVSTQFIKLVSILIIITCGYLLWIDYRIHHEFEGRRWSVPARVYSRPAEIYAGHMLSMARLVQRLELSGYQLTDSISVAGEYSTGANMISVHLRSFDYWDEHFNSKIYDIQFQNGAIFQIKDRNSGLIVPILRIDPVLIGKIYPDNNEDRILIGLSEAPEFLKQALIGVEDREFYRHFGIDFKGILRAIWVNIRRGQLAQGGSTITQQLVKNYFLTHERTMSRKVSELLMAILLERRYSKDEILAGYLNEVYLGQDGSRAIHGFGTAAEFYFNKPINELREDQLALLVGLVRGASFYNPRRSPDRAKARRNLVLSIMAEQGLIRSSVNHELQGRSLDVIDTPVRPGSQYAAFLDLAKSQLLNDYNIDELKNDGLIIYTTLEPQLQIDLERITTDRLNSLEKQQNLPAGLLQSAMLVVNPVNGDVRGLYGGSDIQTSGFNRAIEARRPVGSLIKPFVYLTALSDPSNYSLLSTLSDEIVNMTQEDGEIWRPENYDKVVHGKVSLMEALANSYNLATVHLGMEVGINRIVSLLKQSGISADIQPYPSLLLGSLEATPYEVTQLYQMLANGGYRVPLNTIQEVLTQQGEPVQRLQIYVDQVWDEKAVFLTNYLLSQVVENGTAQRLPAYLGKPVKLAGKTGTSDNSRDSWFAGFGDDFLAVTWIGNDDNSPTSLTGASGAMLLWSDIVKSIDFHELTLIEPEGISWVEAVAIEYDGECTQFEKIPYTGASMTVSEFDCQPINDESKSIFDIKGWFQ